MGNKKRGKILAVLLGGALLGAQIPGMVWAEETAGYTGGICEHHPVHTAECGYQEAVPEQPCRHEHTEECYEYVTNCVHEHTEECYPLIAVDVSAEEADTEGTAENAEEAAEPQTELVRGPEPTACTHVCSEESGCVTKTLNCIHEDKVNADGSITPAVHDASCGYAPAVEGKECTFVCEICSAPEETDSETETSTEETPDFDGETETDEAVPDEAKPDEAVTAVQTMIDALPSVEEVKQMTKDEQREVYDKAQDAADAYFDELTEEQQEQVDLTRLMDLMNYFNGQVSTMAAGYTLTNGVLTITSSEGLGSFRGNTSIQSVIINGSVEGSIGESAFWECSNLESITIKNGAKIEGIGENAFYKCTSLTSVTIEEGATIGSIGVRAFEDCSKLTSITISSGMTSIGSYAFNGCTSLEKITIPNSVTSIGSYAFRNCSKLTSITIPSGMTSIGNDAFRYCTGLTSITIPGNVTSIGTNAFYECSGLKSITISEGVTSIGENAFYSCTSLTSITIPNSVTSISNYAFMSCKNLTEVTLPATAPTTVSTKSFLGQWSTINFIIPETSIGTETGQYNLNASPWNQIVMLNGSSLIRSVAVTLTEPVGGSVLPATASCTTTGVESSSVSWKLNGSSVVNGEKAEYGKSYTVEITLTALTSTDTTAMAQSYRFVDSISATLNGAAVTATVSDSGKTLKISKTYQMPKQAQDSPDISIDYQNEKLLNTTADMEYSTDGEGSWKTCSKDMKVTALGWDGTAKNVWIRLKETADKYASESTKVTIPARPAITVSLATASSLTVSVSLSGTPEGVSPEVQYQLVTDGSSIDSEKWQKSGEFTNLKADTAYTAYVKCDATSGSFASDNGSGQQVSTSAASYTVSIPSATLTAGDSTSKAEISADTSKNFDLGYNGQVQVKVKGGEAVNSDGVLTLTRPGALDTLTSAMLVNKRAFTDITKPVVTFTISNYSTEKAAVSFAEPETEPGESLIPAGTYSGTVTFLVSYSEQEGETE